MHAWLLPAVGARAGAAASAFVDSRIVGRQPRPREPAVALAFVDLAVAAALLVFVSAQGVSFGDRSLMVLVGALLYAQLVPYVLALQRAGLSAIAPLAQLTPAATLLLGGVFLGDTLRVSRYAAVGIVLVGSAVVGAGSRIRGWRPRDGTTLPMIASSLMTAAALVLLEYLLRRNGCGVTLAWMVGGMGAAGLASTLLRRPRASVDALISLTATNWIASMLSEGVSLGADALLVYAISRGPVSLVVLTAGLEPLFVLALVLARTDRSRLTSVGASRSDLCLRASGGGLLLFGLALLVR